MKKAIQLSKSVHRQLALVAAIVLPAFSSPGVALAAEEEACASAYNAIKGAHTEGKLLFARENAVSCARACAKADAPELKSLGEECVNQWIPRLETDLPTVVLVVRDASGKETSAFKVELDGAPLAMGADGKAIELDPGNHSFRFMIDGQSPISVTLPIKQGEKNKRIEGNFGAGSSAGGGSTPVWPFLVGGGGIVLGGIAAGLAASTLGSSDEFYELCPLAGDIPSCTDQDKLAEANSLRDGIRARNGAAIGLGAAGGALLITGVIGLITAPSSSVESALMVLPEIGAETQGIRILGSF